MELALYTNLKKVVQGNSHAKIEGNYGYTLDTKNQGVRYTIIILTCYKEQRSYLWENLQYFLL